MKKWIALLLTLTLLLSATACGKKKAEEQPGTTNNPSQTQPTGQTNQTEQKPALPGTMEENVNKIIERNPPEFMGGLMPVDLQDTTAEGLEMFKSYTGLDSSEKIKDIAVYEPMMGSQAFSLVLVRVTDAADAKGIAQQMKENINPRKWICAMADEVMAAGYGDVVMFVMLDTQLGLKAQSYVDAFAAICGGQLDFTI